MGSDFQSMVSWLLGRDRTAENGGRRKRVPPVAARKKTEKGRARDKQILFPPVPQ